MNEHEKDPISYAVLEQQEAGSWIGSPAPRTRRFERVDIPRPDRASTASAHVQDLHPMIPAQFPTSPAPRFSLNSAVRRLWHRGREAKPLHIINADDRTAYNDWRYPWGLVCRVDQPDGGSGSGVIVGPRHVLTASHCVDWSDLRLTVQVHTAGRVARATADVIAAGCYTKVGEDGHEDTVDEDYAVLVLDQRLGDRFGTMGVRTYDSGWDERELWSTIGYADDFGNNETPLFMRQFFLDEDALDLGWGRAMSSNVDAEHGQSGSPVFAFWDRGPYVVAIVTAEVGDDNYCSGGSGLTGLVTEIISLYP